MKGCTLHVWCASHSSPCYPCLHKAESCAFREEQFFCCLNDMITSFREVSRCFCFFLYLVCMHGACALALPLVGAVEWYKHCDLISYCNMNLNVICGYLKVVKNTAMLQSLDPAWRTHICLCPKKSALRGLKIILSLFYWAVFFLLCEKKKKEKKIIWGYERAIWYTPVHALCIPRTLAD